jgi:hypothetical protein
MKKRLIGLGLILLAMVAPRQELSGQIFAKERFAIEPRVGIAFPTGDFGNVDADCPVGTTGCDVPLQTGVETGWRWEAQLHYLLTEKTSLVMGFARTKFGCTGPFCGFAAEPEARGLSLGLRSHLFSIGTMDIWGEGGGVFEEFSVIRSQNSSGDPESSRVWYPWSPGFYGGAGVDLALTGEGNFFFTPGFRFRFVPSDPPSDHSDLASVDATYIMAEVGFKVILGAN